MELLKYNYKNMKKILSLIVFVFSISSVAALSLSADVEYANKLAEK
jgi:hypothetical protein